MNNWDPNACLKPSPAPFQPGAEPLRHCFAQIYQLDTLKSNLVIAQTFMPVWHTARSNSGVVKQPHNYVRNHSQVILSRTYEEVRWMRPEIRTAQQLTLPFLSWVTPPSLCVKHQLWGHKHEGMLRRGEKDHLWGSHLDLGCPFNSTKQSSLLCLYFHAGLQNA